MFTEKLNDFTEDLEDVDFVKLLLSRDVKGIKQEQWYYVEIASNLYYDYVNRLSNAFDYVKDGMHIMDLLELRKLANLVTAPEFRDIVFQCPNNLDAQGIRQYCIEQFNKIVRGYEGDDLQYFLVFRSYASVPHFSEYVFNFDYCMEGNPDNDSIVRDWVKFLADSFIKDHGDSLLVFK